MTADPPAPTQVTDGAAQNPWLRRGHVVVAPWHPWTQLEILGSLGWRSASCRGSIPGTVALINGPCEGPS